MRRASIAKPRDLYRVDFYGKDGTWWCHYYSSLFQAIVAWVKYVIIGY